MSTGARDSCWPVQTRVQSDARKDRRTPPSGLILLPGLGADQRLFDPQRPALPPFEVPGWLPPEPREPLPDYAARLAAAVSTTAPLVLGGVSFGGMVALEMAHHLEPRAVVLIASCTTGAALPPSRRALASFGAWLPARSLRPPRFTAALLARGFGATTPEGRRLIDHFLETRSPAFVKWALGTIVAWRPRREPPCPVFHIHGASDRLIPVRRVRPTRVVPGAGHLLNVTHAGEVNAFLAGVLSHVELPPE